MTPTVISSTGVTGGEAWAATSSAGDLQTVPLRHRLGPRGRRALLLAAAAVVTLLGLGVVTRALPALTAGHPDVLVPVGYLSAIALGASIALAPRIPAVAVSLVVAVIVVFARFVPGPIADGPLNLFEPTALVAIAWSAGQLGRRSRLVVGVPVMAVWVVANAVALGLDVPTLMMSLGWWVVGRIMFSWQRLRDRLAARVQELAEERERYAAESVRLERGRIARDLHDIVAHCMTVIVIQARAGQQLLTEDADGAGEAWEAITATLAEADADLDALFGMVTEAAERPLTTSVLADMVSRAEASGSPVTLLVRGGVDRLPGPLAGLAHRVLQESLTNALRYAPGAPVVIDFDAASPLRITVTNAAAEDVGVAGLGSGRGLEGLRQRLRAYGLDVSWGPDGHGGWRVAVGPGVVEQAAGVSVGSGVGSGRAAGDLSRDVRF